MTDYRSLETLDVLRDGERVAVLRRLPKGCEFRYTDAFLASNLPAAALHLPKRHEPLVVEGVANLPTFFAGLLPEGVMLAAIQRLVGASADDLFALLAATGGDAIGDVETRAPGELAVAPLPLADARDWVERLLAGQGEPGRGAIAGVQPKATVGELVQSGRRSESIVKFSPPEFPDLLANEAAVMRLARRCGLETPDVRLRDGALVVTRFDRPTRIHVEDLTQVMDRYPHAKYTPEYFEIMDAMTALGVSKAGLLDALRLYAFSYMVGNGDLHAKNVSLIRDAADGAWRLSPVYDLLSTLPYGDRLPGADRMALALRDESFGRFEAAEFVELGERYGLLERAVVGMLTRTARGVLKGLPLLTALGEKAMETVAARARGLGGNVGG